MTGQHYCNDHKSRFYKNERTDMDGNHKVWYSHKMLDGKNFCVEKAESKTDNQLRIPSVSAPSQGMFMCNAMNNAITLAANGVIQVDQIGDYYKKIYSELLKTA